MDAPQARSTGGPSQDAISPDVIDVLAIAGSPRRGGNTDRLLEAFVDGARSVGAHVRTLVVSESDVGICQGCNSCSKTGECVVDDGMQEVYTLLDAATSVVVSSPVYFASVPGSLKALYDRCQPYWARRYVLGHQIASRRAGALLLVRAGGDPYGSDAAVTTTRSVFAVLGIDLVKVIDIEGPDGPQDILDDERALKDAREAGARMGKSALQDSAE